jgi:phosphopantetheinyl transferase
MNRVILAYSQLRGDLPAAQRARLRAQLPYARALRMSVGTGRQSHTYLGLALACRLLSAAAGRQVQQLELRFTRAGKPYVPGQPHFSIAHTGDWVLCALAADGEVGIDAEAQQQGAALPPWRSAFDAEERAAARITRTALGIWAAKEAAIKAAGATLAELAQVRVRGRHVSFRGRRWYCRTPRIGPRLIVRLVTARPVTQLVLRAVPAGAALAT